MPRAAAAHCVEDRPRTDDVRVSEDVTFAGLLLCDHVLEGLQGAGFQRPSPIQLRAIPIGRCGVDLIVQAKSGTGKTCVLAVLALELLASSPPSSRCQTLVLAPTREVAVQVARAVTAIGSKLPGLAVHALIGGLPLAQDVANLRRCNIAVGTPGRVRQLVDSGALNTESVRLFVMDEADKLMEDSFVEDINLIYSTLPNSKQMVALSATYPERLAELLARYMRSPTFVRLGRSSAALLGVRQYAVRVDRGPLVQVQLQRKLEKLLLLLTHVGFTQCLVFSNHQSRAETLCTELERRGWPSSHLSSALSQERRLQALDRLTSLRCRVLVTTDLAARGVDSPHADLVVHLDVPWDGATYLHRVGRAGRYGSLGAAVALVSPGEEEGRLSVVAQAAGVKLLRLEDPGVERDLKTCDVEGWKVFDLDREEDLFETTDPNEGSGNGDVPRSDVSGAEIVLEKLKEHGSKEKSDANGGSVPVSVSSNDPPGDTAAGSNRNAKMNGSSATEQVVNSNGRKVRKAKRRNAPKLSDEVEQEVKRIDAEKNWLEVESKQLEAATDGWAQAAKPRVRKPPVPSERQRTPYRDSDDAKGEGQNKQGSQRNQSPDHGDDGGQDSDDSFTAMLEAYKRDQQRNREDSSQRQGSGQDCTDSDSGSERKFQQQGSVLTGAGDASWPTEKTDEPAEKTDEPAEKAASPTLSSESHSGEKAPSRCFGDNSRPVNGIGVSCGNKLDKTDQLQGEAEKRESEPAWNEKNLRSALMKLHPKLASSLTQDELSALMQYIQFHGSETSNFYQEALQVIGKKGVNAVLARFGESEADLRQILRSLEEKPPSLEPKSEVTFGRVPSDSSSSSPKEPVPTVQASEEDGGVQNSDVQKSDDLNLASQAVSAVTSPPAGNGITSREAEPDRSSTYIGEEIRKVSYIPEEAAAFQRRIRQQAAQERAKRAAERAKARAAAAEAEEESTADESSSDEEEEPVTEAQGAEPAASNLQPPTPLPSIRSGNAHGGAARGNGAAGEVATASGAGCRPKTVRGAAALAFPPVHRGSRTAPVDAVADESGAPEPWPQRQGNVQSQQWFGPDRRSSTYAQTSGYPPPPEGGAYDASAAFWGGFPGQWRWWNGWSQPNQYSSYFPGYDPSQHNATRWSGYPSSGNGGWGGSPHLSGEAWSAMLSRCYQQQTGYITAMSRFYADYYRERHG